MDAGESDHLRRSTRRAVRNRFRVPDAEHYVGYVADEETPEMIMKRFEKLEEAMQTDQAPLPPLPAEPSCTTHREESQLGMHSNELTEDQVKKVMEASNAFTVRDAFQSDLDLFDDLELSDVDSSDIDFELSGEESGSEPTEGRVAFAKKRSGNLGHKCERNASAAAAASSALGKSLQSVPRAKGSHTRSHVYLRIPPPPLQPSWGRTVQPYEVPDGRSSNETQSYPSERLQVASLTCAELRALRGRQFLGVMVNPLWCTDSPSSVSRLKRLELHKICPEGFVFIWIPKTALQSVWKTLKSWGFIYVENLTWVQLKPNNKVHCDAIDAPALLPRSHWTLYIFRRRGKDIEIKHQRSSDVVLDVRTSLNTFKPPREAYNAIETMLPTSKGKLLELWSAPDAEREGWLHIFEREGEKA